MNLEREFQQLVDRLLLNDLLSEQEHDRLRELCEAYPTFRRELLEDLRSHNLATVTTRLFGETTAATCDGIRPLARVFATGEMEDADRERVERHTLECRECLSYIEGLMDAPLQEGRRPQRGLVALLVVLAAVVGGGAAYGIWGRDQVRESPETAGWEPLPVNDEVLDQVARLLAHRHAAGADAGPLEEAVKVVREADGGFLARMALGPARRLVLELGARGHDVGRVALLGAYLHDERTGTRAGLALKHVAAIGKEKSIETILDVAEGAVGPEMFGAAMRELRVEWLQGEDLDRVDGLFLRGAGAGWRTGTQFALDLLGRSGHPEAKRRADAVVEGAFGDLGPNNGRVAERIRRTGR